MKKGFVLFCILLSTLNLYSQDLGWWYEKHGFEGEWSQYLIYSPSYFGPNALPVPTLKDGYISDKLSFEIAGDYHYSKGDKTTNLFLELFIPVVKDRVGFNVNVVALEYYKTDTITRDLRRSIEYDGTGFATGDIYVSTIFKLIKDHSTLPDLLFSVNLKTASGSNLGEVRFTDSPGYYFDLTASKKYFENSNGNYTEMVGMLGFYCYQTNGVGNKQNDAMLYGFGLKTITKKIIIKNQLVGYLGYFNNGDKPMVYRLILESNMQKTVNYKFQLQQGINDNEYTTLRFSAMLDMNMLFNKTREK